MADKDDKDELPIKCNDATINNTACSSDSDPKEMRFCVKVFYEFNGGHHSSELCSIMTNFMK